MLSIFLALSLSTVNSPSDPDAMIVSEELSQLASKSFRLTENMKLVLDGSKEATEIARTSSLTNSIVFFNEHRWRARRKLPFIESSKEVLYQDSTFSIMTPTNRKISARSKFSNQFWEEVVLSPLRLAKEWTLIPQDATFDEFISKLRKSNGPLTNVEGDRIEFTPLPEEGMRIFASGRIIQDGKTKVRIESNWELKDRGKIKETDLALSLARSE